MNIESRRRWTRREFLKRTAAATAIGAVGLPVLARDGAQAGAEKPAGTHAAPERPAPGRSKVVLIRDADALDAGNHPRPEVIARMLDQGVAALMGASGAEAAWAKLLKPADTVGIKSNSWRFLPTPREIEDALRKRVLGAGVPEDRVAVDDH